MPRAPSAPSTEAPKAAPHARETAASAAVSGTPKKRLRIGLALQGGGSHGAFTWGVLDRLLEDERQENDGELAPFSASSKTQNNRTFLELLHTIGSQTASNWPAGHAQHLGKRSTFRIPNELTA
jgi:hypothetical protein